MTPTRKKRLRAARWLARCVCGHERRDHKGAPLRCRVPALRNRDRCECARFQRAKGTA